MEIINVVWNHENFLCLQTLDFKMNKLIINLSNIVYETVKNVLCLHYQTMENPNEIIRHFQEDSAEGISRSRVETAADRCVDPTRCQRRHHRILGRFEWCSRHGTRWPSTFCRSVSAWTPRWGRAARISCSILSSCKTPLPTSSSPSFRSTSTRKTSRIHCASRGKKSEGWASFPGKNLLDHVVAALEGIST